jgi:acid phosphatase family membrane protein YuiD
VPSNHSTIVSSIVPLIFFREGLDNAIFVVAFTSAFLLFLMGVACKIRSANKLQ